MDWISSLVKTVVRYLKTRQPDDWREEVGLEFNKKGNVLIALPDGRLDTSNAPEAEKAIEVHIDNGDHLIVIDFSKTSYISSAGLRVILKTAKLLTQKGGGFALCNTNEQIQEVLQISGFNSLVNCVGTLDEAIEAVS
jgi:anti-sigma B factor antagonist